MLNKGHDYKKTGHEKRTGVTILGLSFIYIDSNVVHTAVIVLQLIYSAVHVQIAP